MKLFHLSDLHLGKRLKEISLIEDQEYILKKILTAAGSEKPDGILIAGDVYDRSIPSEEAMKLSAPAGAPALTVATLAVENPENYTCLDASTIGA